ncbi:sugar ABC transporter ATP-binding protein [Sulfitobacter porphyrae]|uniref:Sugar ABC transporter ATP-binding protein n=1 Tax=Sulfitobacter porphyrae TaxID=1246864 RepID=A0ABW2B7E8_9RHOB|nr:ABC transporter [Sulfitobacter porphyrae]
MSGSLNVMGICKTYPGVRAAREVSFSTEPGEVIGVLGKNGAGKSTLMRILGGVERQDAGSLELDGRILAFHSARDAVAAGIVTVHQELNDVPMLSVAENICLGLGYPGRFGLVDRRALAGRAAAALDALHSGIDPAACVGTLSVAERRMVMVARALAAEARVIILDEPTASLTEAEITELFRVIRKLSAQGVTFLYVSHRLNEIFEICSRLLVMRDGELVADRAVKGTTRAEAVALIAGRSREAGTTARRAERIGEIVLEVSGLDPLRKGKTLSLSLRAGEVVGLAGLAGSGRTELLRQIMAADPIAGATHRIHGRAVRIASPRDAWAQGLGLLPEDRRHQGVIPGFPIYRNITLASLDANRVASLLPFPRKASEVKRAQGLIERLRLKAGGSEDSVISLSGGNQQKAILARNLAAQCQVLLLDEPTHGIDVSAKEEIYVLINELAERGMAVLLVSSELSELTVLADSIIVLRDGEIISHLPNEGMTEEQLLHLCLHARESDHASV